MKKIKKINTICNRAAALGCVEDIQIEIKGNYDFFYEYLKMFPHAFYGAQRSPFCFRTAAFRSQRPPIF